MRARTRAAARSFALDMLGLSSLPSRGRALATVRMHVVYLHQTPDLSALRRLVGALAQSHTLTSYGTAVELARSGTVTSPSIAFTFDDGFASNFGAAQVLEEFGVTGCFFVPTGFIGIDSVAEARQFFETSDGVDEGAMSWGQVEQLRARGHEIGNHTAHHRVLAWVSPDEAADEIAQGRRMLSDRLGAGEHFAWPRGRFQHVTPKAVAEVFAQGHVSCASAERGSHPPGEPTEPPCLRRDHLDTAWPLRHNLYFVATSAQGRSRPWPPELQP